MTTYIIKADITIIRQEGDQADIQILVPDVLSLTGATIKFAVKTNGGRTVLYKNTDDMTIVGQLITIPLEPEDTKNKAGSHRWEIEISNSDIAPVTIGRGDFILVKELIV